MPQDRRGSLTLRLPSAVRSGDWQSDWLVTRFQAAIKVLAIRLVLGLQMAASCARMLMMRGTARQEELAHGAL